MKKILSIVSSPRGEASYSIKLSNALISKLQETYPGSTVKEKNVAEGFPHLAQSHLNAFFTPSDQHTSENKEFIQTSQESIAEIRDADILVIGAPMYNFAIPSTLKAWIDQVVRAGVTFKYDSNGPEGLIKGKKAYIIVSSGSVYSDGPMKDYDFVTPYLKTVLGFIGITDVEVIRVEGTSVSGIQDAAYEKAVNSIAAVA
ncbi:FMN-dependent NADH-azoreductase [Deminuibacter soli]|uniref:FMN dependent NADH:quinone oxidoreductase n=1 Tax=Deminuibacter soli TaxID=2291815 RepID=A0A3E1NQA6_9BACT|nr:NAD(P)H-dependent oxidoreductase [Deminuibacter soli]RFM30112.1 FMN-dependent NADH-azoreductase [Deminuibacter soli]